MLSFLSTASQSVSLETALRWDALGMLAAMLGLVKMQRRNHRSKPQRCMVLGSVRIQGLAREASLSSEYKLK